MIKILYTILKVAGLAVLPFILLIRGATFLHSSYEMSPWMCLLLSVIGTTILLFIYFTFFYGRLTGKLGDSNALKRRALIALLVVLLYAFQGIVFISSKNMKNAELKEEMTELHPVLRLSLSTLVFLDRKLLITDASRVPEDYKKMGLKTKGQSLHYKQKSTGYSHAVDLRTNGRTNTKNKLVKLYFQLMGFQTLRHYGTADHLHVSLKSADAPGAK